MSKVPKPLITSLAALVAAAGVGGWYYVASNQGYVDLVANDRTTTMALKVAMVMGNYFESSNRHIGKPYVDKIGTGQPWTVCGGITSASGVTIDPGKTYTERECYELERFVYQIEEIQAIQLTNHWARLTVFQQASVIDFIHNLGAGSYSTSTMRRKFNSGDFVGGCKENPRWVYSAGMIRAGLVTRRASSEEICLDWDYQTAMELLE